MSYVKLTGRTKLGQTLNKTNNKTDDIKSRKTRTVYGYIKSSINDTYSFKVTIIDHNKKPMFVVWPISLMESPQDLAARFGSPSDMVLEHLMVRITYYGHSIESGTATVVKDKTNRYPEAEQELAGKSNSLPVQGTAFAPPGASVI